jgi:hypothetical protein
MMSAPQMASNSVQNSAGEKGTTPAWYGLFASLQSAATDATDGVCGRGNVDVQWVTGGMQI